MQGWLTGRLLRLLACFVLTACAGSARALDPAVPLRQLHHDMWSARDGMPGNIWDMAQCADGTIWFSTPSGLFRSDGSRFDSVRTLGGKRLLSNVLTSVRCFVDGSLWIGYRYGGVSEWRDGVLRHFADAEGMPHEVVREIARDRSGRTWILTSRHMMYLDGARWRDAGKDWGLADRPRTATQDASGALLVFDFKHVYRLDESARRFVATAIPTSLVGTINDASGALWRVADDDTLQRVPAAVALVADKRVRENLAHAEGPMFDVDGNLWDLGLIVTRFPPAVLNGVDAVHLPGPEKLDDKRDLSGSPMSMMKDREGNIWIGTDRGVDRFRHNRFLPARLPDDAGALKLAMGNGAVWAAGSSAGKRRLWRIGADGAAVERPASVVTSLATAHDGALLIGGEGFIERWDGRTSEKIPFPKGITKLVPGSSYGVVLLHDDGTSLWAAFTFDNLYRYADGAWRPAAAFGLPAYPPNAMAQARDGSLWFGYRDDEVYTIRNGKARRYGAADGIDTGVIGALYDDGATILIGGDRGLAWFDGQRFRMVNAGDPQALNGITGIVRTPDGDLWVNGSRGLVHIAAAAWEAQRDAPGAKLPCERFDVLDGYPGSTPFRAGQSSVVLDRQGRIWLSGTDGVARIDPARLYRNRVAPSMQLRGIEANGRSYEAATAIALPPGTTELQIAYAANSYTMPERVRFRYRLDGIDAGWHDVGARRTAFYTSLGPGEYRFLVEATNEDGVRSVAPATVAIRIAPTFVQSPAFKGLCAAAILLAAYGLYRWRLHYATLQLHKLLRERIDERERIARLLHDTVMQSVQALLMLFERAYERLPAHDPERPMLGRTLSHARATVVEGRDELSALRAIDGASHDLSIALAPLGQLLSEQYGVMFTVVTHGSVRAVRSEVAFEIIFVGREALQNAFRHAGASAISLEIDYGATLLTLRVRDNGKGLTDQAITPGHWGLAGMRERAAILGAALTVLPAAPSGTVVTLTLNAARVYLVRSDERAA